MSVVPGPETVRLVCHRDERRSRPPARPPRRVWRGRRWAEYPIDPEGGGTWIGMNDAGLMLVLLNRTRAPGAAVPAGRPSRGLIIPALLQCDGLAALAPALALLGSRRFAPFRLVALAGRDALILDADGDRVTAACTPVTAPLFFTSSSLGDDQADAARRPWFDRLVRKSTDPIAGQRRLHARAWTPDPRFGLLLDRADARSVSRTIVDIGSGEPGMRYEAMPSAGAA